MRDYHYSPYPTIADLRSPRGLSAPPSDPTASKVPASAPLQKYYRVLASGLGIKIPPRDPKLSEAANDVMDVLEGIDVSAAQLQILFNIHHRRLVKGGAVCRDLYKYNRLAVDVYDAQMDLLRELRQYEIAGLPLGPPWPPLFYGFGTNEAKAGDPLWKIDCTEPIIQLPPSDKSKGVGFMLSKPCAVYRGELNAPIWVPIVVGGSLLGALVGAISYIFKKSAEIAELKAEIARIVQAGELLIAIEEYIQKRTDECVARGGEYTKCLNAASDSAADPTVVAEILRAARGKLEGRSWLWYAGIVGVAVGGVLAVSWVVKRRARNKRRSDTRATTRARTSYM